jgi:hypothetical protein
VFALINKKFIKYLNFFVIEKPYTKIEIQPIFLD